MSEDGLTPQQRWHKKNGYIKKSFWMYKEQAEIFKKACEERGVPRACRGDPALGQCGLASHECSPRMRG